MGWTSREDAQTGRPSRTRIRPASLLPPPLRDPRAPVVDRVWRRLGTRARSPGALRALGLGAPRRRLCALFGTGFVRLRRSRAFRGAGRRGRRVRAGVGRGPCGVGPPRGGGTLSPPERGVCRWSVRAGARPALVSLDALWGRSLMRGPIGPAPARLRARRGSSARSAAVRERLCASGASCAGGTSPRRGSAGRARFALPPREGRWAGVGVRGLVERGGRLTLDASRARARVSQEWSSCAA